MKYKKTTLSNGLQILVVPTKNNPSVTVMALVEVGADYESKAINGASHFLEHMMFKGTTNRPSSFDIAKDLESIGAENNAFTSREMTAYYAKAEKRHYKKILEVVSDLYLNPLISKPELEKERGVILQEISMYEDMPKVLVWDTLSILLYGNTPMGRDILGSKANIRKLTRVDLLNYRKKHYTARNTTMIVVGDVNSADAVRNVKKYFARLPRGTTPKRFKVIENQKRPALLVHKKKTDQTHIALSFRAWKAKDKRNAALAILAGILGQGFSSRLFQKMREEMGACYYISSQAHHYSNRGQLTIVAGIEAKRIQEVVVAILEECRKFKFKEVSQEELSRAKEYFIGRLYMDLETTDALARFYLEEIIASSKIQTPLELEEEIRKVTPKDIMKVAKEVFADRNLNLAVVGNISEKGLKQTLSIN